MTDKTLICDAGSRYTTWRCTPTLRRYWPHGGGTGKPVILQQAWECLETGQIEWRDIPDVLP